MPKRILFPSPSGSAVRYREVQNDAEQCNEMQSSAVRCWVSQNDAKVHRAMQSGAAERRRAEQWEAEQRSAMQSGAVRCRALQRDAEQCRAMQHANAPTTRCLCNDLLNTLSNRPPRSEKNCHGCCPTPPRMQMPIAQITFVVARASYKKNRKKKTCKTISL